eukprot:NODE_1675_length_1448_cov_39.675482_g1512_i0.p2 GENE.NODE_1675_length_1448_cov_39.675482_g1512_i0~~NODE_1675_length_1448_cov_39.675482_g1512_i0.p2  ORF type:complete len:248 (+),score=65.71 NODE_1675_length_1448_cov_39.675482_g1512_i0:473-1216(+)
MQSGSGERKVSITLGRPYVAYRETITSAVRFDFTHKRQSGGSGQYAKIVGYVEPLEEDFPGTFDFINNVTGTNLTPSFIQATKKGFEEACQRGPQLGNPVWGVRVVLEDGAMHAVDSSELAFKIAAAGVFQEVFTRADATLLQPIMRVEVSAPLNAMSSILSSFQKRNGKVTGSNAVGNAQCVVLADVPLKDMFGYMAELRSMTAGRGEMSMEYLNHEQLEQHQLHEVLAAAKPTQSSGGDKSKKKK